MIVILILLVILFVSIYAIDKGGYDAQDVGCFFAFLAIAGLVVAIGIMATVRIATDLQIEKNQIRYETLCYKIEMTDSDFEDFSKTDVADEVAQWNKHVKAVQYWSKSIWMCWFYNKEVADAMQIVDLSKYRQKVRKQ